MITPQATPDLGRYRMESLRRRRRLELLRPLAKDVRTPVPARRPRAGVAATR